MKGVGLLTTGLLPSDHPATAEMARSLGVEVEGSCHCRPPSGIGDEQELAKTMAKIFGVAEMSNGYVQCPTRIYVVLGQKATPIPDHRFGITSAMTSAEMASGANREACRDSVNAVIVNQGVTIVTSRVF